MAIDETDSTSRGDVAALETDSSCPDQVTAKRIVEIFQIAQQQALALLVSQRAQAWPEHWVTIGHVAKTTGQSVETLKSKAKRYGVGAFRDGRWWFELNRWNAFLAGRNYPRLGADSGNEP